MAKRAEILTSFQATDQNGNIHTLHVMIDNPSGEIEVLSCIVMSNRKLVKRLKKGRYKVSETGEILTSNDPNAP